MRAAARPSLNDRLANACGCLQESRELDSRDGTMQRYTKRPWPRGPVSAGARTGSGGHGRRV